MSIRKSKQGSMDGRDWLKTLIITVGTAFLTSLLQLLQEGSHFNWVTLRPAVLAAVSAGVIYILKQLSTTSDGKILGKEPLKDRN